MVPVDGHNVMVGRITDGAPDGVYRILVDRLWPRGVRKVDPPWDLWLPAVAPSTPLRRWYHAHVEQWELFQARYREELESPEWQEGLGQLLDASEGRPVILLTFARKVPESHVPVLQAWLQEHRGD